MSLRAFRPSRQRDAKGPNIPGTIFLFVTYPYNTERSAMVNLLGNLRYVMRQFRMSPVFTAAAMLTLALGIGGTTAIFTLIHAVMLRSLPVADPSALYRIGEGDGSCLPGGPQDRWGFYALALFQQLKAQVPEFEDI